MVSLGVIQVNVSCEWKRELALKSEGLTVTEKYWLTETVTEKQ